MHLTVRKITLLGLALGISTILTGSTVSAHVVVRPAEVSTASFQTFTVSVPNEKEFATTEVKILTPSNLKHVTPTVKPGWHITTEKEGEGEEAHITSITWSGGNIPIGQRDEFTFSAQVPSAPTNLEWKAYQTYVDGLIVAWDVTAAEQPKKADGSPDFSTSGPLSVTKVKEGTATPSDTKVQETTDAATKAATQATYIGAAGIVLGLIGIFFGTRKQK